MKERLVLLAAKADAACGALGQRRLSVGEVDELCIPLGGAAACSADAQRRGRERGGERAELGAGEVDAQHRRDRRRLRRRRRQKKGVKTMQNGSKTIDKRPKKRYV